MKESERMERMKQMEQTMEPTMEPKDRVEQTEQTMEPKDRYVEDLKEWQENQYNPGYYLGGKIPGTLLYNGRPKMVGVVLIVIGLMILIPFGLGILDSFRGGAPRLTIDSVLLLFQILIFGGLGVVLVVNGIRKIAGKRKSL